MVVDWNGLQNLSRSECLRLLATHPVGRVAISRHALPVILPVTYRLLGEEVVFAAGSGSESLALAHENVIAFEVDEIDLATRSGWSVAAVGMACRVQEGDRDWQAATDLDLRPWVGHQSGHLIRLATDRLSGRRLIAGRGISNDASRPSVLW